MSTMGEAIRRIREQKGLQQQDVADAASLHLARQGGERLNAAVLSQIERGRIMHPSFDRVRAIARALGMSYNELLVEGGWADPFDASGAIERDALEEVAREHPDISAELERLRSSEPPEQWEAVRQRLADFMALGLESVRRERRANKH